MNEDHMETIPLNEMHMVTTYKNILGRAAINETPGIQRLILALPHAGKIRTNTKN